MTRRATTGLALATVVLAWSAALWSQRAGGSAPEPAVDALLAQLSAHAADVRQVIDEGAFARVFVAAFKAKDVALVLEAHTGRLPPGPRERADAAIGALVRAAWLLDAFGDLGNRQQVQGAHAAFAASIAEIQSAFSGGL